MRRSSLVLRYSIHADNSFAGHCEVRVLDDGLLEYKLFFVPFDGKDDRTIIVDPANPEHLRAVQQLHLRPELDD